MRFLGDESCDANITRALRQNGHDVLMVADVSPQAEDSEVIRLAMEENRILLTEDKDFGQLVFASGSPTNGVILLRYAFPQRPAVIRTLLGLVEKRGQDLGNRFVVVQPGRIRTNPPLGNP
jgi:predicted nuclease of predicted toxin-antitoxin system